MSQSPSRPRGKLYVVAAPSGTGKTSLVRAVIPRMPALRFSVSYTTRPRRETEVHSRDYFFVSHEEFKRMIDDQEFLEHATVYGNSYGTSRRQVEEILTAGENVLLEIDWQGAQQIARAMPERRSIFILPPSRTALETRLRGRKTDSDEVIAGRLRESMADLSHWSEFDYVVVNDDFERATTDLESILRGNGEHLRRDRAEVRELVRTLLQ
ncbi:MAG TPA: guanylate kinase [Steroidobacteraceae bacterium]|nr:guanylate kinase [Steroidobacteraceae bacterium]